MTGAEIKRMNWQELEGQLHGLRLRAWTELRMAAEPMTTRDLADCLEMDLLMVRPRVTELVQMGFVRCAGRQDREGLYEAVGWVEARAEWERRTQTQLELKL